MHTNSNEHDDVSNQGDCPTRNETRVNYNDYFSIEPSRGIKRAKSVRDAFPPSVTALSSTPRRRSYFHSRSSMKQKADELCNSVRTIDHKFTFSFDSSDAESLPELSDCDSTTNSVQSAITPTKSFPVNPFSFASPYTPPPLLLPEEKILTPKSAETKTSIFDIPELVYKIIEYADIQNTVIPKDKAPVRRKPLSLNHATLIHDGDFKQAQRTMGGFHDPAVTSPTHNVLHTCLLVNKLFNRITKEVMGTKIVFSKEKQFVRFANSEILVFAHVRPSMVVLNKLFHARQASLDRLTETIDYSSLSWLEIFMCPRLKPSISLLHPSLKSFIITGSKVLDDALLVSVAERCPNLEVLDVRACEAITDYGVYSIGSRCRKLRNVNLGRKRKGFLISDHSVSKLAANNPYLHTVGLAGCHITDRTIWQLAMSCGKRIERLSLNNCLHITNNSIPAILNHNLMPSLSVLELRFIENITNLESIVSFKRRQNSRGISVLIELCETLLYKFKACEKKMDSRISHKIFQDISDWANKKEDEDISYEEFIRARGEGARPNFASS